MPTLAEIATTLNVAVPDGADPSASITAPNTLAGAAADEIALLGGAKYLDAYAESAAGYIVVQRDLTLPLRDHPPVVLEVDDAELVFLDVLELFAPPRPTGVHATAVVDETAVLGQDCYVGPHCFVGPRCVLGDRVTLQANVTIGGDGFGYRFDGQRHRRVPHLGHVEIGDDVEIGSGTCVDRGKFPRQPTVIGAGTKIDNLCQVGHNVRIGRHCIIVSQTGIAGSVTIGDGAVLAARCSVRDHLTIGDGVQAAAMTGFVKDVPAGARIGGMPAVDQRQFLRTLRVMETLPELAADVRRLARTLQKEG